MRKKYAERIERQDVDALGCGSVQKAVRYFKKVKYSMKNKNNEKKTIQFNVAAR